MTEQHRYLQGISRRHFLRQGSLFMAALVTACTSEVTNGTTSTTIGAATSTTAGTAPTTTILDQGPRQGGELIHQITFLRGDMFIGDSIGQALPLFQFAWPLFTHPPHDLGAVQPMLAESHSVTPDGLTHTVALRPGLTFHDGSPIGAEAVVANLRGAFFEDDPLHGPGAYAIVANVSRGLPGIVADIRVVDELTVAIDITEPRSHFEIALVQLPIMHPEVLARTDVYGTDLGALQDAGSGPFRVTAFEPGEFIEYERWPDFFQPAYLDRLRLQANEDPAARVLALTSGQADAASDLETADWNRLEADPHYRAHVADVENSVFVAINTAHTPELEDVRVRRALQLALNRDAYVEAFWGTGLAEVATQGVLRRGLQGFADDVVAEPYDPDAARALLDEAGVESLELRLIGRESTPANPLERQLIEAVQSDLAAIGVNLDVQIVDTPTWLGARYEEEERNDLWVNGYGSRAFNGPDVASLYFNPDLPHPAVEEVGPLLADARVEPDEAKQTELVEQAMRIGAENVATLPIAYTSLGIISTNAVHDLLPSILYSHHEVWIEA